MSDVPSNLIPTRVTQLPDAPVASEDSLMMIIYQGNNYKIRVGDLLSVAGVPITRQVIAGTGLAGGGQLASNVTLSIAPGGVGTTELDQTGVTPGIYGSATNIPVFTVDADGRVTAASVAAVGQVDAEANTFLAGPTSGPDAPSEFRAIINDDLPVSGVSANTYGSDTMIPVVAVNSKGIVTSVTEVPAASAAVESVNGKAGVVVLTAADVGAALPGANSDITSMTGLTGGVSSPDFVQFSGDSATLAAGKLWYDSTTGALNVGMGSGNITQQIGEELFVYGKASSAINDTPLKIVYQTGTVGASSVITFAPTTSGITDGTKIVGIATESIALNGFGRVTAFGIVRGIDTSGSSYSETWADGDTIWYNPTTGNPTNVKPSAPNIKVQVGVLIRAASGGSGSIQVEINHGSVLGGTDSNVQLTSVANKQLLQYDAALGYWKNVNETSIAAASAAKLTGGAASQIVYQSATDTTAFLANGTAGQVLTSAGSTAPVWSGISGGTF